MLTGPTAAPRRAADSAQPLALWLVDLDTGSRLLPEMARRYGLVPELPRHASGESPVVASREVARAALRIVLAGYVGLDAAAAAFVIAPGGKPTLGHRSGQLAVDFSLAHCDTAAMIAISHEGPVGVDLEAPRSVRIAEHRRAMLLEAAASLAPRDPLPDGPGEARFLQAWVRLEALAKLTGEGLGALLGRLGDDTSPIANSVVGGSQARLRDVAITSEPPLYAAVAGIGPSLTTPDAPKPTWLPIDRSWLDRWIVSRTNATPGLARNLPPE